MLATLKRWVERWTNYVGDREVELQIRRKCVELGMPRDTRIKRYQIAAVERPGWIQIYTFECHASLGPGLVRKFGVVRDDGRKRFRGTQVELMNSEPEQRALVERWSEGLIRAPRYRRARTLGG